MPALERQSTCRARQARCRSERGAEVAQFPVVSACQARKTEASRLRLSVGPEHFVNGHPKPSSPRARRAAPVECRTPRCVAGCRLSPNRFPRDEHFRSWLAALPAVSSSRDIQTSDPPRTVGQRAHRHLDVSNLHATALAVVIPGTSRRSAGRPRRPATLTHFTSTAQRRGRAPSAFGNVTRRTPSR